jgi:hypothetical protein
MNTPLVSRSLFWRYYGSLGRLTLLNVVWGAALAALLYSLRVLGAHDHPTWRVLLLALLGLAFFSVVSASFGRAAFGVFVGKGFRWEDVGFGFRRFALDTFILSLLLLFPIVFLVNNLALYMKGVVQGSWVAWALSFLDLVLLVPLALGSVWLFPMLFFREDGAFRAMKRSLWMVLGHPWTSFMLLVWSGMIAAFYVMAPVAGLLLGGTLLLGGPSTALEKLFWGYRISFQGRALEEVQARWDEEAAKGWRDILRPWESKRS